jgi:hypothetical protein
MMLRARAGGRLCSAAASRMARSGVGASGTRKAKAMAPCGVYGAAALRWMTTGFEGLQFDTLVEMQER